MNLRELLKYELWSKKTTRTILVGLAVLIVGFFAWAALEQYWITPWERKAGRAALAKIDEVQNFASTTDPEFSEQLKQAERQIDVAKAVAWTTRDRLLAFGLSAYCDLTKIDREHLQRQKQIEQRYPITSRQEADLEEWSRTTGAEARTVIRTELHAALY